MKARQVMRVMFALMAGAMPAVLWALSGGPDPRYTGAPGDKDIHPFSCATAGCHAPADGRTNGKLNFYGGNVTATFSSGSYTPGTPVTITVKVSDPVNTLYGFQMSARQESNLASAQAGRFVPTVGATGVLCDNGAPRSSSGNCPVSAPVEFIEHVVPSSTSWTFTWTPPATNVGPVHFYVAGNAVNGNGHEDDGDHPYTAEYVLTPAAACVTDTPAISGIISVGNFGARNDFAPGSWIEVYGSNFSTITRAWRIEDFNGNTAPNLVDRVKVTINGQDGFVGFISPGQVNLQAPENAGTGPMSITVTNCDRASAPITLNQLRAAPGVLAPPQAPFLTNGKQLLGAFIGATLVGLPTRPVKPGEVIVTYGAGFGITSPAVAAGQVAPTAEPFARLSNPVIKIGGVQLTPDQIGFAGLAPGYVGLYQFNLVIPDVPDGDQVLTMNVNGGSLTQTLFITVKR